MLKMVTFLLKIEKFDLNFFFFDFMNKKDFMYLKLVLRYLDI